MCRTYWEELLKYQPLKDYKIKEIWYDEDEEYNEGETKNLYDFLKKREKSSKELLEYFIKYNIKLRKEKLQKINQL
jgi:hypothetical protein